jgi:cytidine deaminase
MERDTHTGDAPEDVLFDRFDPYQAFVGSVPQFVNLARHAAETRAHSYRNFHVGAALYAGNDDFSEVIALHGANSKPSENHPKRCAEMDVIDQAEALGFTRGLGLVVAGTSDAEKIMDVNGRVSSTLHPCKECREKMADSGLITDESIIITVSTEEDVYQANSHREMERAWESDIGVEEMKLLRYNPITWRWIVASYEKRLRAFHKANRGQVARLALSETVGLVA